MALSVQKDLVVILAPDAFWNPVHQRGISLGEAAREQGYDCCLVTEDSLLGKHMRAQEIFSNVIHVTYNRREIFTSAPADAIYAALSREGLLDRVAGLVPVRDPVIIPAAQIAARLKLPHPNILALERATYKWQGRVAEEQAGLATPRFTGISDLSAGKVVGFPMVMKPSLGTSSISTHYIQNQEELDRKFQELKEKRYTLYSVTGGAYELGFLLEEYIEGREFSAEVIVRNGKVIPAVLTERISTGGEKLTPTIGIWPPFDPNPEEIVWETLQKLVTAYGFDNCLINIDLKLRERDGACLVIDVNAGRYNGWHGDSMAELCTGIDLRAEAIALSVGAERISQKEPKIPNLANRRIVRIPLRVEVPATMQIDTFNGLEELEAHPYVQEIDLTAPSARNPPPGEPYSEVLCTVFVNLPQEESTPNHLGNLQTELTQLVQQKITFKAWINDSPIMQRIVQWQRPGPPQSPLRPGQSLKPQVRRLS